MRAAEASVAGRLAPDPCRKTNPNARSTVVRAPVNLARPAPHNIKAALSSEVNGLLPAARRLPVTRPQGGGSDIAARACLDFKICHEHTGRAGVAQTRTLARRRHGYAPAHHTRHPTPRDVTTLNNATEAQAMHHGSAIPITLAPPIAAHPRDICFFVLFVFRLVLGLIMEIIATLRSGQTSACARAASAARRGGRAAQPNANSQEHPFMWQRHIRPPPMAPDASARHKSTRTTPDSSHTATSSHAPAGQGSRGPRHHTRKTMPHRPFCRTRQDHYLARPPSPAPHILDKAADALRNANPMWVGHSLLQAALRELRSRQTLDIALPKPTQAFDIAIPQPRFDIMSDSIDDIPAAPCEPLVGVPLPTDQVPVKWGPFEAILRSSDSREAGGHAAGIDDGFVAAGASGWATSPKRNSRVSFCSSSAG